MSTDDKLKAVADSAAAFSQKARAILEMAKSIAAAEQGARLRETVRTDCAPRQNDSIKIKNIRHA